MERNRILNDGHPGGSAAGSGSVMQRRRRKDVLTRLAIIGLLAGGGAPGSAEGFGSEPGGRTIGGPAQTEVKSGSSRELLTFLHRGPTPFRFVCVTGLNEGPGTLTVIFKSRIGETMTVRLLPGQTRVVCGETTGVEAECHAQGGDCTLRWRVDEPK